MTFYIFKRNKKTNHKKVVKEVEDIEEAREVCFLGNNQLSNFWFEFTEDIEYTKN